MSESESISDSAAVAEAAGETVGEAKWTALRQLENRFPGLDKSQVEFTIVSEGERGLLGVGFVPARVIARVAGPLSARSLPRDSAGQQGPLSPAAGLLKELLEHVCSALDADATISVRDDGGDVRGTFHGGELGLLIGKHGQTIDAIQHLAAAVISRRVETRPVVVVDAAGYRDRRRSTLESIADRTAARVAASGRAEELEPMPPSERKIIHLRLKDRGDVQTASEGVEPSRCIVVRPAP